MQNKFCIPTRLKRCYILCLRPFLTLADFECYGLAFGKRYTACTCFVDLTEVYKHVIPAVFLLDESVTFFIIEPFYRSLD